MECTLYLFTTWEHTSFSPLRFVTEKLNVRLQRKMFRTQWEKKSLKIVEHIEKEKMLNNSQFNIEQCS